MYFPKERPGVHNWDHNNYYVKNGKLKKDIFEYVSFDIPTNRISQQFFVEGHEKFRSEGVKIVVPLSVIPYFSRKVVFELLIVLEITLLYKYYDYRSQY